MPNYFIQAQTGHFNPMSFDEMVKPLNMYKEYYEQNEEKLTELQATAKLWEDIANSELDSEYADKYNQYAQSLYDTANQLSNGMSYDLRNQIRNLRSQSAMVNQIENAYALRAKDIDAYNELMLKDPSRIGATNPRNIKLNEYFGGPVQINYGVSGDRLNTLGASQSYNMNDTSVIDTEINIIDQMQMNGYNMNEIMNFLEQNDSALYKMAENIITGDNMPFRKGTSEYNQALIQTINGIASGINQRKAELAKASKKSSSGDGGSGYAGDYSTDSIASNIGLYNDATYDDKSTLGSLINEKKKNSNNRYDVDENGKLISTELLSLKEQLNQKPDSNSLRIKIEQEQARLNGISNELLNNGVPGNNDYERYLNFMNFYSNANQMSHEAIKPTGNAEMINKLNTLYKYRFANTIKEISYYDEDGDLEVVDGEKEKNKIIDNGNFVFTTNGLAIEYNGKYYFAQSTDHGAQEFSRNVQALNTSLMSVNGQNSLYNDWKKDGNARKLGNTDIYYTIDGDDFVFLRDTGNGSQVVGRVKRYDALGAKDLINRLTFAVAQDDLINIK